MKRAQESKIRASVGIAVENYPLQCSTGLDPANKKTVLFSSAEQNKTGMSRYEKSRHGYGDTHVGVNGIEAVRRLEIRTRRSVLDAGEGKLLV